MTCSAAGVTKGAFFHHFKSKEDLAVAAANFWAATTGEFFAGATYHTHPDPLDRVLGYLDLRKAMLTGAVPDFTCLAGTMVQEAYGSNPMIRAACERAICEHAEKFEVDVAAAIEMYRIEAQWTAASLALHMQAVLQGAFILAKATGDAQVAADCIDHLRRYVELLFNRATKQEEAA
jgi:TetR/AcrR family transcriptional repressor of nem operon